MRLPCYEGEEYSFELSKKTLIVKQKFRGEILKETEDTINCNFTFQDIDKLEEFEQQLDQQLQESIAKN